MTAATGLRPVTLHLVDSRDEVIGSCAMRLVLPLRNVDDPDPVDLTAWAITHMLGTVAGGTHTEVALVDDTAANLPERTVDDLVRLVAGEVYGPRGWAFHYRPEQVADSVLRHGSRLRERIEVTAVELWAEVSA